MTAIDRPRQQGKGAPRMGRLARLKLTEPLLLFTVPTLALLAAVLVVPVVAAGAWPALLLVLPALVLHATALWAARTSVYSPAGMMRSLRDALTDR